MRHLAAREARELWRGLAVIRSLSKGSRVVAFVMVAVFSQIFRNWILLHAVGVRRLVPRLDCGPDRVRDAWTAADRAQYRGRRDRC